MTGSKTEAWDKDGVGGGGGGGGREGAKESDISNDGRLSGNNS